MKKLLLGAASAVALLAAGSAFAAGNASTIDQIGYAENASVDQSGSSSDAIAQITQGLVPTAATDEYNSASVTQGGVGNQAYVMQSQDGYGASIPSNVSNSDQQGAQGRSGSSNSATTARRFRSLAALPTSMRSLGNPTTGMVRQSARVARASLRSSTRNRAPGTQHRSCKLGSALVMRAPARATTHRRTDVRYHGPGNLWWSENVPNELPSCQALSPTLGMARRAPSSTRLGRTTSAMSIRRGPRTLLTSRKRMTRILAEIMALSVKSGVFIGQTL